MSEFVKQPNGSYNVVLDAAEAAGVATIAKVRAQSEGDVLKLAAAKVTQELADTVAKLRSETLGELYRRLDALSTDRLVGLLDVIAKGA